jgi:hypothetical protein
MFVAIWELRGERRRNEKTPAVVGLSELKPQSMV